MTEGAEADFPPVGDPFQQLIGGWILSPAKFLEFTREPDRFLEQLPPEQAEALKQGLIGLAVSNLDPRTPIGKKVRTILGFAGDYLAAQTTDSSAVAKVIVEDLLFNLDQE